MMRHRKNKLSKESVHYREFVNTDARCGTCVMFDHGQCTLVEGFIEPFDVCSQWEILVKKNDFGEGMIPEYSSGPPHNYIFHLRDTVNL